MNDSIAGGDDFLAFLYKEGRAHYDAKDYEKAGEFFEKAAELGHAEAQYNLALMYDEDQHSFAVN